ncbi:hypothetical protein OEZ86_014524 [Tetradesmus obliquus]|nr:hypothetical protein OEZ86_014524 [Tetradesmus obliquus]
MTMAATRAQDADPAFHTYDLTLTDRELDDFLVFMEQQTTGCYSDTVPQLPDAAADFPCLQLQPHTDSPSNSEGSESIEMDPPVVGLPPYMGSTGSFSSAAAAAAAAAACGLQGSAGANNNWEQQQAGLEGEGQQLPASCVMDISATLPKLEAMEIKVEAEDEPVTAAVTDAQQQRTASLADGCGGSSSSGGKGGQVSHSTVEKQRRDRLNSLIDELSDIVPPADPKYGNDASSVRRPKHVVLSDTINLLKAMQAKLQIEEAEICTLKQQAAAVTAIAAASHQQQGLAAAAAGSPLSPADYPTAGLSDTGSAALPLAPEGGVQASGVLVEQGVSCLFVKVNCRDRKGLLSDVVGALRAFPVVICTAAITTTKDGTVHDVFEVRIEDDSVTPEDIQCAVHMALFNSERARSKRLRQDEFPAAC